MPDKRILEVFRLMFEAPDELSKNIEKKKKGPAGKIGKKSVLERRGRRR